MKLHNLGPSITIRLIQTAEVFSPQHMKTYRGSSGIAPPTLLTSALDGGVLCTSRTGRFTPGQGPDTPCKSRLGGPQSRYGCFKKRNPLTFARIRTADSVVSAKTPTCLFPFLSQGDEIKEGC
jgi:hypothetical protein